MLRTVDLDAVSSLYVFASTNEHSCHVTSLARPILPPPPPRIYAHVYRAYTVVTLRGVQGAEPPWLTVRVTIVSKSSRINTHKKKK